VHSNRTALARLVIIAVALAFVPIHAAWTQGMAPPFGEIGETVDDLVPRVEALEENVADVEDAVAGLDDKTTLSDLDCASFPTVPGPLAVRRGGQWECADMNFVRETRDVPAGTRELSISATCPAGTTPFIGGTSGTRFVPPDPGTLVLANSGPGPSFDQWSANWVSIRQEGTLLEATLSVSVFCLRSG